MKLCFSNIAWDKKENKKIIELLNQKKIRYLEYAPDLIIKNYDKKNTILKVKKFWEKKQIKLYSMQSVLFGIKNAFIFGSSNQQNIFYNEVKKKILLAKKLGTKVIVFGSPKSKKTFGKPKKLLDFLFEHNIRKIIKICEKKKITFCLEANPRIYGTKYLTHTNQALNLVKKINNKYLKLNLDMGTIISNNEDFNILIKKNISHIGHAQISCPKLKNPLIMKKFIKRFVSKLHKNKYKKVISVEFLKQDKNGYDTIIELIKLIKNV